MDEIRAQNVLTEARVSGAESQCPPGPGHTEPSVLPSLLRSVWPRARRDARVPLLASPRRSPPGPRRAPGRDAAARATRAKFRKAGDSGRRPWRLRGTLPRGPPAWRKVAPGLPTPPASLWLRSSLGGGAGARPSRPGQGPRPARAPARRPRPARRSPLALKSNRSRLGPWQGQGPGRPGAGDAG